MSKSFSLQQHLVSCHQSLSITMHVICAVFLVALLSLTPGAYAAEFPNFSRLFEQNKNAVVNISVIPKQENNEPAVQFNLPDNIPIPEIYRWFFEPQPRRKAPQETPRAFGSGFIISKDGYILTNNHVVNNAEMVFVRFYDRSELEAEIIGTDARSDIALLKVNKKKLPQDLPTVKLATKNSYKVGEWVAAIGSPFGFEYSITSGIISAKGRNLPNESYVPFIQSDVPINPGNSGGPLFNMEGEVIGINSQIFTRSGGFMGLSFAIPVDIAMDVVTQLKEKGKVVRGWLGVVVQNVDRNLALSFGLDKPRGALISDLEPDGPADKAGLQNGDIILEFDGESIELSGDLPAIVGQTKPGEEVSVELFRHRKKISKTVAVGELPEELAGVFSGQKGQPGNIPELGIVVDNLSDKIQSEMKLDYGVIITAIEEGPALEAGLRSKDIVTAVHGTLVRNIEEFQTIVQTLPKKEPISIRIIRQGRSGYTTFILN